MTEFQGLDEKKKARCMKKIHEKGVSVRQISRLTGISKGVVERLLKAK
jgi:transposase